MPRCSPSSSDRAPLQSINRSPAILPSVVTSEASLVTTEGKIAGDLFIDCSGARSLLLGEHLGIPISHKQHILFNDSALAAQVPNASSDADIASCTLSTAQDAGWIWDIGCLLYTSDAADE